MMPNPAYQPPTPEPRCTNCGYYQIQHHGENQTQCPAGATTNFNLELEP